MLKYKKPGQKKLASTPVAKLIIIWGITIIICVLLAFFTKAAFEGELKFLIIVIPNTLFAFLFIFLAIREARAFFKFGRVPLIIDRYPVTLGEPLQGRIELPGNIEGLNSITVTLVCKEVVITPSKRKDRIDEKDIWTSRREYKVIKQGNKARADIEFQVPEAIPFTTVPSTWRADYGIDREGKYYRWELVVKADVSGDIDLEDRVYHIRVQPPLKYASLIIPLWKRPEIYSFVSKELVPIVGVVFAGWSIPVVILMFWLETFIIFCFFALQHLVMFIIILATSIKTESLIHTVKLLSAGSLLALFGGLFYCIYGGVVVIPVIPMILSDLDTGLYKEFFSFNPVIIFDNFLKIARDYHLAPAVFFLLLPYGGEIVATIYAGWKSMPRTLMLNPTEFIKFMYDQGFDAINEIYEFRLRKMCLFLLLMGSVVLGFVSLFPSAAIWSLLGVIILKIIFDLSNINRDQTVIQALKNNEYVPRITNRRWGKIQRTNRGQVWMPNK